MSVFTQQSLPCQREGDRLRWRDSIIIKKQLSLPFQRVRVSGGHLCATVQKHRPSRQARQVAAFNADGGIQKNGSASPTIRKTTTTQTASCRQSCFISALPMLHTPLGAHRSAKAVMSFYPLSRQNRQLPLMTLKGEPYCSRQNAVLTNQGSPCFKNQGELSRSD